MVRYEAMPEGINFERIEGVVYMVPPLSAEFHGNSHFDWNTWLGVYKAHTPGVTGADNSTTRLDIDNDPQPDVSFYILPQYGGRVTLNEKGYIVGAVDLIVEVSASSTDIDLGPKFNAYRRNGVREYIVHRTYDNSIDYFVFRNDQYDRLSPDASGIYRSEAFPGLWLNGPAMIAGDLAWVFETLQEGLATAEHAAFVGRLKAAAAR
jgi:Uma2 family endonuclease